MPEQITQQLTTAKYSPKIIIEGYHDNEKPVAPLKQPFLVPIYQRLYTWEHEHVDRLLKDLWVAYNESPQDEYFIGAVVVSPAGQNLELIDGQQRMTTLWLIASVLCTKNASSTEKDSKWHKFMAIGEGATARPRLVFSGRQADKEALERFVQNKANAGDDNSWLKNETMRNARKIIIDFLKSELDNDIAKLHGFGKYIWEKATFVITHLHTKAEKERFFDTMNSRGVQLEKHEILKALLLHDMGPKQRVAYAKAWDLCADIHGFIEGDLQTQLGYGLRQLDENYVVKALSLNSINEQSEQAKQTTQTGDGLSLEQILAPDFSLSKVGDVTDHKNQIHYKSPVSFPVFLLHVLRIFKKDTGEKISLDDKNLIKTFKASFSPSDDQQHHVKPYKDKQQCMDFIECLLECRLLLDNFVIKGQRVEGSDHANWRIWSRLTDKNGKERRERTDNQWASIMMLQSMMYFSRDLTHAPWLTETLLSLRELNNDPSWDGKVGTRFLEKLKQQDKAYMQTRIAGKSLEEAIGAGDGADDDSSGLGTATPHYWFYKLEYCLWELWFNQPQPSASSAFKRPALLSARDVFRMRHVTSVEHVSPQSKNNGVITNLDRFGNLALISVGANSSYSDKDPSVKASEFKLKLGKGMIESLKLAHIFNDYGKTPNDWNNDAMIKHENAMVSVLKAFHPELECDNNKEAGSGI